MIYFFNEMICILLVIAITIIFIKTIYSNKIQFVTNEEHFSNRLITLLIIFLTRLLSIFLFLDM